MSLDASSTAWLASPACPSSFDAQASIEREQINDLEIVVDLRTRKNGWRGEQKDHLEQPDRQNTGNARQSPVFCCLTERQNFLAAAFLLAWPRKFCRWAAQFPGILCRWLQNFPAAEFPVTLGRAHSAIRDPDIDTDKPRFCRFRVNALVEGLGLLPSFFQRRPRMLFADIEEARRALKRS